MRFKLFIFLMLILQCGVIYAQEAMTREEYIATYADLAMKEMARTGIPASITLAQGCLESDNGNSRLARDAKNHFGIKCHDWTGRKIRHDDDERNECFRKYRSVEASYLDHSEFLTTKQRYAGLFELEIDDYKAWARGLKKAGYATSHRYADLLIQIIEENELQQYDQIVIAGGIETGKPSLDSRPRFGQRPPEDLASVRESGEVLINNRVEYIIAEEGDTPSSLRAALDMYPGEIYRYNDLKRGSTLDSGQIIYLQPKRRKAAKGNELHTAFEGESLWDVSQIYGIKLSRLSRMNHLPEDALLEEGMEIWLRRSKPLIRENSVELDVEESSQDSTDMQFQFDNF